MASAAVHRVGARAEGLALAPPAGSVAGRLAVNDVGRDRQNRLRMHRTPVGRVLADLGHEPLDEVGGDVVHPRVVVAECRELAFRAVIDDQSRVVADYAYLSVLDGRQTIGNN